MKKTNSQLGITLIALVVTIVVLLILAGITINIVLSDGGIFAKAQQAGVETRIATIKDYTTDAITSLYAECASTGKTVTNAVDILKANFPKDAEWTENPTATAEYTAATDTETSKIKVTITATVTTTDGKYTISYDSSKSSAITVKEVTA